MSNLLNKSNHPVHVKKIKLELWTLRSEIEAAIAKRLAEHPDTDIDKVDIEDIKTFYQNYLGNPFSEEDEDENDLSAWGEAGLDTGENENKKEGESAEQDEEDDSSEQDKEDESSEDEEEEEEQSEEKDDTAEQNEADAKELAKQMLDQGATEAKESSAPQVFKRCKPAKDKITHAEILLSDVNMQHALIFTSNRFITGQNVVTEFQITKPFVVTGETASSQNIGRNSKIIKEQVFPFRTHINFNFLFPTERSSLRDFLSSIEPEIPTPPKKIKRDDEDDDDFDDLGF